MFPVEKLFGRTIQLKFLYRIYIRKCPKNIYELEKNDCALVILQEVVM